MVRCRDITTDIWKEKKHPPILWQPFLHGQGASSVKEERWMGSRNCRILQTSWTRLHFPTIESGKMTKDLALITSLKDVTVLNSKEFILAIRENLEKLL